MSMRRWQWWLAALGVIGAGASAHALTLPEIFSRQMVLQRDRPVPVWGTAEPGAEVTVSFGGQKKSATADAAGKWRVALDPLPASAAARELSVSCGAPKPERVSFDDVLVGEVWLCTGQSNMFWPLGKIANQRSSWPGVQNGEAEVAHARWPLIRLNCAADYELGHGGWHVCAPESARGFSATAYFFGRELHRALGVPIGLINRSIGGTSLQAWTPKPELEALPFIQQNARLLEESRGRIQQWNREFAAFREAVKQGAASRPQRPPTLPDELETARKLQNHGELHERYVAPLVPFALRGTIWYQGESNAAPRALAVAYEDMLAALIASRRRLWNDPAHPFYFVQLPIFQPPAGEHWHVVREAMRRVHQRTSHTGMVVTYDFCDSTTLHPAEKQEVGRRLALWALARTYDRAVAFSGPLFRVARFDGHTAVVEFDYAQGLRSRDGQSLRGFELAGDNWEFHPAEAIVAGETIRVHSAAVPQPRHVRFFHGGLTAPNLVNGADLPASPFVSAARF